MSTPAATDRGGLCERIDLAAADGRRRLDALRGRLVSQGEVVSPAGRQRTIDVFGEPLTPRQVVERICADVRAGGRASLLDYTRRLDGVTIAPESLFVEPAALAAARGARSCRSSAAPCTSIATFSATRRRRCKTN